MAYGCRGLVSTAIREVIFCLRLPFLVTLIPTLQEIQGEKKVLIIVILSILSLLEGILFPVRVKVRRVC